MKGARKSSEQKLSVQDVMWKTMTAFLKRIENTLSSTEVESKILENTNEKLMRKHKKQNEVVGRRVGNLVKSDAARSVRMAMCVRTAIPMLCLRKTSEPKDLSDELRFNWTERSEQGFRIIAHIDSREKVVP